jgi:hypothetical protein
MNIRKYRAYGWIAFVSILLLSLVLTGFLAIWTNFSESTMMNQLGLQRARVERIAKSAIILNSHPSDEQRTQAISEIQVILPVWQQTQTALQTGDEALSLPRHVPTDIQSLVFQTGPDFAAITTAAKKIVAAPNAVAPDQVAIIMQHENDYYTTISQIALLWIDHLNVYTLQVFVIEVSILAAIVLVVVLQHIFLVRKLLKKLKEMKIASDTD